MFRRMMAILLAVTMLGSTVDLTAFAAGADEGTEASEESGAKSEYSAELVYNSAEEVKDYLEWLLGGGDPDDYEGDIPSVEITVYGENYTTEDTINVPIPFYTKSTKLSSSNLYVYVEKGEAVYTGYQTTPSVEVYFGTSAQVKQAKKIEKNGMPTEEQLKNLGLTKLEEGSDYTLSYGTNITAGRNKGTVKITGLTPYGGSMTQKFDITPKTMSW